MPIMPTRTLRWNVRAAEPELCDELVDRLVHGRPDDDVALVAMRLLPQEQAAGGSARG